MISPSSRRTSRSGSRPRPGLPPTPLDYLPVVMNNYSGTVSGMMAPGGQISPFVSPLPVPAPFQSPLPPSTSSLPPYGAAAPVFDPSLLIIAPAALAAVVARKKGRKGAVLVASGPAGRADRPISLRSVGSQSLPLDTANLRSSIQPGARIHGNCAASGLRTQRAGPAHRARCAGSQFGSLP